MYEEILKEIGLTGNEIKVYLALLELGYTKTGMLIKKTKIHTSKVYDALERLIDKGLVTYSIEANIKHFSAVDPSRLKDYLEEKKKKIEEEQRLIGKIIPQLKLKTSKEEPKIETFRGFKGTVNAFEDILKTLGPKEEYYVFPLLGSIEPLTLYFDNFHRRRMQKKIKVKIIVSEELKDRIKELKKLKLTQIRKINKDLSSPATLNIYKNKTLICLGMRKEPIVFLVEDKDITNSFKKYFEVMWRISKRV
jgi:HTH-type transcriptional regulator, sugar sensing transcriptional regulator